jgi:hypothetical protein
MKVSAAETKRPRGLRFFAVCTGDKTLAGGSSDNSLVRAWARGRNPLVDLYASEQQR